MCGSTFQMYVLHFSLQGHMHTFGGQIHKTCHVKYVGCFISGLTTVHRLVRSTFRMCIHSKCTKLISGLTQYVDCVEAPASCMAHIFSM
jgi:hypothetical protein